MLHEVRYLYLANVSIALGATGRSWWAVEKMLSNEYLHATLLKSQHVYLVTDTSKKSTEELPSSCVNMTFRNETMRTIHMSSAVIRSRVTLILGDLI
jgi:hypothetical protein